jgi:hypothetical protein
LRDALDHWKNKAPVVVLNEGFTASTVAAFPLGPYCTTAAADPYAGYWQARVPFEELDALREAVDRESADRQAQLEIGLVNIQETLREAMCRRDDSSTINRPEPTADEATAEADMGQTADGDRDKSKVDAKAGRVAVAPAHQQAGGADAFQDGESLTPVEVRRKPLTSAAACAYEILLALPPYRGLTGPELLAEMDRKGANIDQSTLTKRIIPQLKQLGLQNRRRVGYYFVKNPQGAFSIHSASNQ